MPSNTNTEVWLAIPSASPERCRLRLPAWREMGYRIAVLQNQERADIPADITVWADRYPGWAASINHLARNVIPTTTPIIVTGGDDMLPDPNHSAQQIAQQFLERFPDTFGVMQPTADQYLQAQHHCGSPFIGRAFFTTMYQGLGPLFPAYKHNWADNELHWVARCIGALWMRPDLSHAHHHFTRENTNAPHWWTNNVAANDEHDCALYLARKHLAFPNHQPLHRQTNFDLHDLHTNEPCIAEWRWSKTFSPAAHAALPQRTVTAALQHCADINLNRVAIYAAGDHTRRAAQALATPPVNIAAIIDENTALHGTSLFAYPILPINDAIKLNLDAIIISSDAHETTIAKRIRPLCQNHSIHLIPLYEKSLAHTPPHLPISA